ncbi:MauE/DoxX family redox-associated membrane protein [Dinghuibacter silviterrae]|uniref:Methylamine utilisation protein MauE domain-containing protein n=1 Tax=Dinghuibacter silviterrae TaxID=1539049 RepID=A0A4R8DPM1_9BACT|nr:MauE/DoxX family redox-associated membrane protein [Dinghuibacter silviterrae]TDW99818.1 hypothetical protein EDB95_0830 [Dinghuibacter silviterrae]
MKKHVLAEVFSCLLILLFVYTASSKLLDFSTFTVQLSHHVLLEHVFLLVAIGVVTSELLVSLLLLLPKTRRAGFWGSAILLAGFTIYLTVMVLTQQHLPCACGGVIRYMTWKQHILFNLMFLAFAVTGIALTINRGSRKPAEQSRHQNPFTKFSV